MPTYIYSVKDGGPNQIEGQEESADELLVRLNRNPAGTVESEPEPEPVEEKLTYKHDPKAGKVVAKSKPAVKLGEDKAAPPVSNSLLAKRMREKANK